MRSRERGPGRYEPLQETYRRVAEAERRTQSQEVGSGRYEPLQETHRRVAEEERHRELRPDQSRREEGSGQSVPDPNSAEARLEREQAEHRSSPEAGRLTRADQEYQRGPEVEPDGPARPGLFGRLRRYVESLGIGGSERTEYVSVGRQETDHRYSPEPSRDDPSQRVPEAKVEREAQAAEFEITGRGEMSDARAARLALLRSIDRDIERENRENEGKEPDLGHDSGDRSR